jgi:hypothetical protein
VNNLQGMARRNQRISGERLQRITEHAAARAVTDIADDIGAESQKLVLFLDGDLAASGETFPPGGAIPGPRPRAGYRYTIVYARRRHEETHRQDGTPIHVSKPGRMPKFLEIPFKAKVGSGAAELHVRRTVNQALRIATAGSTAGGRQGV